MINESTCVFFLSSNFQYQQHYFSSTADVLLFVGRYSHCAPPGLRRVPRGEHIITKEWQEWQEIGSLTLMMKSGLKDHADHVRFRLHAAYPLTFALIMFPKGSQKCETECWTHNNLVLQHHWVSASPSQQSSQLSIYSAFHRNTRWGHSSKTLEILKSWNLEILKSWNQMGPFIKNPPSRREFTRQNYKRV